MDNYIKTFTTFGGSDMLIAFDEKINGSVNYFYDDYKSKEIIMHLLFISAQDLNTRYADTLTLMLSNEYGREMYKEYRNVTLVERKIKADIEDKRFEDVIFVYKYETDDDFKDGRPNWLNN